MVESRKSRISNYYNKNQGGETMKKVYEAPLFQDISAEEFYGLIMKGYGIKGSCYS